MQSTELKRVYLKKNRELSLKRYHPWLFSGALAQVAPGLIEGDAVEVYAEDQSYLGTGHYSQGSIAVKIFSFRKVNPDSEFWNERIRRAYEYRKQLGIVSNPKLNAYRLVNAEGDAMPGLIIDMYAGHAVMQFHSVGMYRLRDSLALALQALFGTALKSIYVQAEDTLRVENSSEVKDQVLHGVLPSQLVIEEYGTQYHIDIIGGQKTGFFIDQRENRRLLQSYSAGRKVLNAFCYSGGFSVAALSGGAGLVHSLDISAAALELARRNVELNAVSDSHQLIEADCFDYLAKTEERYDLIVLDPPAFAKNKEHVERAETGYRALARHALAHLDTGGMLFSFSCSQLVSEARFLELISKAAAQLGKRARVVHQLTQAPCHPWDVYHPEGCYLKGVVLVLA